MYTNTSTIENTLKCRGKKINGGEVIKSAAFFELGVASILQAEAELVQKLVQRKEDHTKLILVNKQIKSIVCCLKNIEEKIVNEIKGN